MASGALRSGEAGGDVIWNVAAERLGAGPGSLVTTVAIRVRDGEGVVVVDVAIGAGTDFSGRSQLV